jgi:hypothetical protein
MNPNNSFGFTIGGLFIAFAVVFIVVAKAADFPESLPCWSAGVGFALGGIGITIDHGWSLLRRR